MLFDFPKLALFLFPLLILFFQRRKRPYEHDYALGTIRTVPLGTIRTCIID